MSHCPYFSVVRNIMYVMVCTCIDISQVVSVVNFYMANLGKAYWAVKWTLQCLRDTIDVGLVYDRNRDISLVSLSTSIQILLVIWIKETF
jgi:hypothetical protein